MEYRPVKIWQTPTIVPSNLKYVEGYAEDMRWTYSIHRVCCYKMCGAYKLNKCEDLVQGFVNDWMEHLSDVGRISSAYLPHI